jgi:threonine dehydratase
MSNAPLRYEDIVAARALMGERLEPSPVATSRSLGKVADCELTLKLENLQRTGSFKGRGALHKLLTLTPEERSRGVIAASAGNHAQGVAYHAKQLGIRTTVVMPRTTPLVKASATRELGAEVILHGGGYDEAAQEATRLGAEMNAVTIHAFDDRAIVLGQGTCGLEILEQVPDVQDIVVPVGGGGLVAGIALAVKSVRPDVRVFGVQSTGAPSMREALALGMPVTLPLVPTIADGINVRRVGDVPFALAKTLLDDVVTVNDEEVAEAVLLLLERAKTVAEGAGAAALAALVRGRLPTQGRRVVAVITGGNIDVNLLSRIIDRGLAASGRLMRVEVTISDSPGELARLLTLIATEQANVLNIHQDGIEARPRLGSTLVELVLETRGFDHISAIRRALGAAGYDTL